MSKNIQVSESFFLDVYKLIIALDGYEMDYNTQEIVKRLETQTNAKFEAMEKRKVFTAYKTSSQADQREQHRKEYLDRAGIHQDWRTKKETTF